MSRSRRQLGRRWQRLALVTCLMVVLLSSGVKPVAARLPVSSQGAVEMALPVDGATENWLALGKQFYDEGQFSQAVEIWQTGLDQTRAAELSSDLAEQRAIAYNYLAIGYQALGNWPAAIAAVEQSLSIAEPDTFLQAQALSTQGNLQLQLGQPETALDTWAEAERIYRLRSAVSALIRNQIDQAQALRMLGYYRRAKQQLDEALQSLETMPDSWLKAKALQTLGTTLRVTGELEQSQTVLSAALAIVKALPQETIAANVAAESAPVQLSLAKTLAALDQPEEAITLAQQVIDQSDRAQPKIEAALLQFRLLQQQGNPGQSQQLFSQLFTQLQAEPASRWGIYAKVNLATTVLESTPNTETTPSSRQARRDDIANQTPPASASELASLLANAVRQAQALADPRAETYALGTLGRVYEQTTQWSEALDLTEQALTIAQQIQAVEITTLWQWQQGRILARQQATEPAIAAYTEAVAGLETLQQDLVVMSPEVQFSFREQVEPVYRQLVALLLQDVETKAPAQKQQRLLKARAAIESLQLAELQNYFREACLTYQARSIESIDERAAVIYPILLSNRLEVIVSLPNQPLQHYGSDFSQAEQRRLFQDIFFELNPINDAEDVIPFAQQLYDRLLRPIQPALEQQSIETLVFVPDGSLRSLPMAILHDGQKYLLETYQIAITPGMQLLNSQPLSTASLKLFSAGVSEARQGFSALPGVQQELTNINSLAQSQSLLNETFTKANFFSGVRSTVTNVVHLATHGQFSSSADDTFLLAWDEKINVRDLDGLLRQVGSDRTPIELLVLSACNTASGDRRAALGIAGIAVRSGARSTLATLWSVADSSTAQMMTTFYQLLTDSPASSQTSRAEALRQAQLSLLSSDEYNHPFYWAPFVLVGNWQ